MQKAERLSGLFHQCPAQIAYLTLSLPSFNRLLYVKQLGVSKRAFALMGIFLIP
jgi:hypothetical protein